MPHISLHILFCGTGGTIRFRELLGIKLEQHQIVPGHFIPSNFHSYLKGNEQLNCPRESNCQMWLPGWEINEWASKVGGG